MISKGRQVDVMVRNPLGQLPGFINDNSAVLPPPLSQCIALKFLSATKSNDCHDLDSLTSPYVASRARQYLMVNASSKEGPVAKFGSDDQTASCRADIPTAHLSLPRRAYDMMHTINSSAIRAKWVPPTVSRASTRGRGRRMGAQSTHPRRQLLKGVSTVRSIRSRQDKSGLALPQIVSFES